MTDKPQPIPPQPGPPYDPGQTPAPNPGTGPKPPKSGLIRPETFVQELRALARAVA